MYLIYLYAIGPDELHREVLKTLLKNEDKLVAKTKFFNKIYDIGIPAQDWLKSTFLTLSKKLNSSDCNDYRTISLMPHIH